MMVVVVVVVLVLCPPAHRRRVPPRRHVRGGLEPARTEPSEGRQQVGQGGGGERYPD